MIEVKTSPDVDEFKAVVVSKNYVRKTFHIDFMVPDCFLLFIPSDALPPSYKQTTSRDLKHFKDSQQLQTLKVRIILLFFIIEL